TRPANIEAHGDYTTLTIPLRGRIWFFDLHSLIGDVRIGITHYWLSADATDGTNDFDWNRDSTSLIGHLGLGYGFRPNRSNPGFRFAIVAGPLVHLTGLGDSEFTAGGAFNA